MMIAAVPASHADRIGLITLGNSGVGKNFLANLLLPNEKFVHKSSAKPVTKTTQFVEQLIGSTTYVIFNIPGLVELNQNQIDMNKKEIDKAFKECSNSVVIFIFGTQNGRIIKQDVMAFNALNEAYPFESISLILVVNNIPPKTKRDANYEGEAIAELRQNLKMKTFRDVLFLDTIDTNDKIETLKLATQLATCLVSSIPHLHIKRQDIHLQADEIEKLTKQLQNATDSAQKSEKEWKEKIHREKEQHKKHRLESEQAFEKLKEDMAEQQRNSNAQQTKLEEDLKLERSKRDWAAILTPLHKYPSRSLLVMGDTKDSRQTKRNFENEIRDKEKVLLDFSVFFSL